ncbi:HSA domain-containing protein, partial [Haematococcus lacustris]
MATAASAEELARENAIVEKAAAIRALWATLSSAFNFPHPEPPRNKTHWDFVLQEASWLAQDFMQVLTQTLVKAESLMFHLHGTDAAGSRGPCLLQERLWRQAAAYQVAHAAAAFKRSSLRQVTTVERKASDLRLGHVREPDKLAAEYAAKAVHLTSAAKLATDRRTQRSRSSSVTSATNSDGVQSATVDMGSLYFITTSAFTPALTQQLEAQDVSRLAQHAEVQALYSQVLDAARKTQPVVTLEDLLGPPGGRRKLRGAALMAGGASGLGLEGDDGLDINGSPLPGRLTTGGVRGRPSSLAVGVNGMRALDGSELGDTGARDKRKRRGRDCGVDEDYEPTKISKAGTGGVRPGPVSGLRADGRALGAELGAAAGASQGGVGLAGDKRGLQQQVGGWGEGVADNSHAEHWQMRVGHDGP